MTKIILILTIISLMGCTTLRYGDSLNEPYSQAEMELSGAAALGFGIASALLTGYVIDQQR